VIRGLAHSRFMLRHEASLIMKLETCRRACLKLSSFRITYHKLCDPSPIHFSLRYATPRQDDVTCPVFVPQVGTTPWQACDKIILFGVNSPAGGCEGIPNLSRRSRLLQTKKIVITEKLVLAKVGNRESSFY